MHRGIAHDGAPQLRACLNIFLVRIPFVFYKAPWLTHTAAHLGSIHQSGEKHNCVPQSRLFG